MAKLKLNDLPTLKISFFIVNLLIFLIGIAYIGIGSWLIDILYNKPDIETINHYYRSLGGIMITVGILALFLSIYGLFLSFWRQLIPLIIYIAALVIILLFGIAVGIVGLSYAATVPNKISEFINFDYFNSTDKESSVADIQNLYGCCGVNLPSDWTVFFKRCCLPSSCCSTRDDANKCTDYYTEGCFKVVQKNLTNDMAIAGGISLGIALPLIIGFVLAVSLVIEFADTTIKYKVTH